MRFYVSSRFPLGIIGLIANITQLVLMFRGEKHEDPVFGLTLVSLSISDALASLSFVLFDVLMRVTTDANEVVATALQYTTLLPVTHVAFITIQLVLSQFTP